eukprot:CAMPEP_0168463766 /NCGR_PEP_ID=MMETSP0228-20121227/55232_1 /TAXON_ID=133427 /ORGANISM="Protoceratium reticulatum, Strain CCCM 535 (=CCMP 1889)" /LENGTH=107 /DNA_ID=CAMNT_0008479247 /DNA_START=73 /DNA_END=393 /DNA_ORIENTATION=+
MHFCAMPSSLRNMPLYSNAFKNDTRSARSSSRSMPLKDMHERSPGSGVIRSLGFSRKVSRVLSDHMNPSDSSLWKLPPQTFTFVPERVSTTPKRFGPRELPLPVGFA